MSGAGTTTLGNRGARLRAALVALLAAACLLMLGGCVYSETITERIIDSDPTSQIDYDLEPVLINTVSATETTDKLPKLDEDDSQEEQDAQDDLPELTQDEQEATTETQAPRTDYNANAGSNGVATNAPTQQGGTNKAEAGSQSDGNGAWSTIDGTGDDRSGKAPSSSEKDGEEEETPGKDGPGKDGKSGGRKSGSTGDYYSDVPNLDDPEIPDNIDEVVAFGNNAVIVSILSGNTGSSALLACDTATKQQTATVLAARGMGTVQALDCTEGEPMSKAAFDKLANTVVPDLVYVTEGENPFSSDQLQTLSGKNISVYTLPALTSDKRIRATFNIVSQTLETGGVQGVDDRHKDYVDFCNGIIDRCVQANGGITGGYDFEGGVEIDTSASDMVTLLIDGWDDTAFYDDDKGAPLDTSTGVATARLGYATSPVNYFLSVGGVLNNASSKKVLNRTASGRGLVWQFASGELTYTLAKWGGLSQKYYDLAARLTGGLFSGSLLCYTSDYNGLGTDVFPYAIAKTQRIRDLLQASAANPNGLYRAYGTINPAGHGRTLGYFTSDGSFYVESCIGRGATDESTLGEGAVYDVLVNPKGLCQPEEGDLCSWTEGSAESILEASWAFWQFRSANGGRQSTFEQDLSDFYLTFYGYTLQPSDVTAIEAGLAR